MKLGRPDQTTEEISRIEIRPLLATPAGERVRRLPLDATMTLDDATSREEEKVRGTNLDDATIGIDTPIRVALETTIDAVEVEETTDDARIGRGKEIETTKVGREGERNSEIGMSVRRIVLASAVTREEGSEMSAEGVGVVNGDSNLVLLRHFFFSFALVPSRRLFICTERMQRRLKKQKSLRADGKLRRNLELNAKSVFLATVAPSLHPTRCCNSRHSSSRSRPRARCS